MEDETLVATVGVHWLELLAVLPHAGVAKVFPDDDACEKRFIEQRWPNGVECPVCEAPRPGFLIRRKLYFCRACHHQFSPTSGTVAHRSRIGLRSWFLTAEIIVKARAISPLARLPRSQSFAERLGISYRAAFYLRDKVQSELSLPHGGLLGRCIATEPWPDMPQPQDQDLYRKELLALAEGRLTNF